MRRIAVVVVLIIVGWFAYTKYYHPATTHAPAAGLSATAAPTSSAAVHPAVARVGAVAKLAPRVVLHGDNQKPEIALTFDTNMTTSMLTRLRDDSSVSFNNTAVLDQLEARHVPATIFMASLWAKAYPATATRIAHNPNLELASHSYAHEAYKLPCYGLGGLRPDEMAADITRSEHVIAALHPVHLTNYFRFPGGCYTAAAVKTAIAAHVQPVEFSVVGGDAFESHVQTIVSSVLTHTKNGSIIVLHLTKNNAPETARALPQILTGLQAKGFKLVRLSQLLAEGHVVYGPASAGPNS